MCLFSVPTAIVYGQNTCFAEKITLAMRSMPTEVSCERSTSTPPAPDYADAEPPLLPYTSANSSANFFSQPASAASQSSQQASPATRPALRYDKGLQAYATHCIDLFDMKKCMQALHDSLKTSLLHNTTKISLMQIVYSSRFVRENVL